MKSVFWSKSLKCERVWGHHVHVCLTKIKTDRNFMLRQTKSNSGNAPEESAGFNILTHP